MDPDRHCLDVAAPPGSSLHYATLFLGARERAALVAIHALRRTLLGIIDTIADPGVRTRKLDWWSNEIMEARDERPRHPVAAAITRHGTARLWSRPEVLAMLAAIGRVSAAGGFESEAARGRFCRDVGGGTARLCAAAVTAGVSGASRANDGAGALGSALEYAILAATPIARSGLMRIPLATPDAPKRMECDAPNAGPGHGPAVGGGLADSIPSAGAGYGPAAGHPPQHTGRNGSGGAARRITGGCTGGGPGDTPRRIAEERARAHRTLAGAVRDVPHGVGPLALAYRTLARIHLAALAGALRKPPPEAPLQASITPIRKLWIAWRTAHGAG